MDSIMDCPRCEAPFDTIMRMPRMLTSCGHTLCNACVSSLKDSGEPYVCKFDKQVILCVRNLNEAGDFTHFLEDSRWRPE